MLPWPQKELDYLIENWGMVSIPGLARKLNRTPAAIRVKAQRAKLGAFLNNGEYISRNQFFKAIGRETGIDYLTKSWVKKGLPIKMKQVGKEKFKVIYIDEFWRWAKKHRRIINFSRFEEGILGKEPTWVKEQRKADVALSKYKATPWTKEEELLLISLLNLYKYTYKDLSLRLLRTEGSIKTRIRDLNLKTWPLREEPHGIWTDEQIKIVKDMYSKGYKGTVIKEYINKSEQAINGKISRMIKSGELKED